MSKKPTGHRRNAAHPNEVVRKEFQKLSDELVRSEKKRQKWKKQCRNQADKLRTLESELRQEKENLKREKKESARRELHTKIQARLDAWTFYHEGEE